MSKLGDLRKLTSAPATAEHQEEFDKQTNAKADDRGLCLIITAQIENELDRVIDHEFGELPADLRDSLYSQDGPLATFSRKTAIAAALGLIGPITRENLRIIRSVRNAFAHAKVPIKFSTAEVAAICADLQHIEIFDPPEGVDQSERPPRVRFESVCAEIMMRFTSYNGFDIQFKDEHGNPKKILMASLP
jgi:hypothetical protein